MEPPVATGGIAHAQVHGEVSLMEWKLPRGIKRTAMDTSVLDCIFCKSHLEFSLDIPRWTAN